jgi:translation elongation factor P/translation initiation factor 5A
MSIGFLSTFYNKKVIYLFIFFIIIGLVVFSYQSGFNKKAYEGFDDSENNDEAEDSDKWPHYGGGNGNKESHTEPSLNNDSREYPSTLVSNEDRIAYDDLRKRDTVGLPQINGNPVFFDIQNGNIYIADGNHLKVISRDHKQGKPLMKYNINKKDTIQSNISSKTFSNERNVWVYNPNNNTEYLSYIANDKKTVIVISNRTNTYLKQIIFNFSENVKPVDLSDRNLIEYRLIEVGAKSEDGIEFVGVFQDKYFRRIKEIKTLERIINRGSVISRGSVIWPDDTETDQDDIVKRIHALTSMQYKSHYIGERVFVKIGYEYTMGTDDYHYLRGKITKAHDDGTYDVEFYKSILEARSKEQNENIPNKDIYTEIL